VQEPSILAAVFPLRPSLRLSSDYAVADATAVQDSQS
jgi:hypothetical protein